jgi:pSer/pThr/pTyr-binding forkhead associated (FHA) protein
MGTNSSTDADLVRSGMLRWISKQKTKTAGEAAQAVTRNELEFLRNQEDFDAEEMASVRRSSTPDAGDAAAAGGPTGSQHPGVTQPAIRFQESLYRPEREPEAPAHGNDLGDPGELTLALTAETRSAIVTISDSALIGRVDLDAQTSPEIDLSDDDAVSRRHAQIFRRGGRFWVRDLDSTNGTILNGNWLEPEVDAPLRVGDIIEVGEMSRLKVLDVNFQVELTDEDEMLSGLLDEALGATSGASNWSAAAPAREPMDRVGATDLLDLALTRSAEAGLLPATPVDEESDLPAEWRLREFEGMDVSSLVEPAR